MSCHFRRPGGRRPAVGWLPSVGMCGIVGYVGHQRSLDVVLEGLRRLEYRGYDSAGIAVVADGRLATEKKAGKLANLTEAVSAHTADNGIAPRAYGHRPHPLGDARRSQRPQRPSAHVDGRQDRGHP